MKRVVLIVRNAEITKLLPNGLQLTLNDGASIITAIEAFDKQLANTVPQFPVKGFNNLLQMVYHPVEKRFYNQVAIQVLSKTSQFLPIREQPDIPLPDDAVVVLVPQGGCSTDWEEPVR